MKRIAVFLDGTWNVPTRADPTNVFELARSLLPRDAEGVRQVAIYREGVGTGNGKTGLTRQIDRVGGGAFGWGLTTNIARAYRDLAEQYEIGDEIYLFGFSRGAYSARSLAGLIRNCGLPSDANMARIDEAVGLYRSRAPDSRPDGDKSLKFRRDYAPFIATSPAEQAWREAQGFGQCPLLRLTYVGVWDTVGALGVPAYYSRLAKIFNRKYEFHDNALSSSVISARHAVAVDETRPSFPPTLWLNTHELNDAQEDGVARYLQEWFPGGHGSVGGGGDIKGLSNATLLWIAAGAQEMGLAFSPERLAHYERGVDALAPLNNQSKPPGLLARLLNRNAVDRQGLDRVDDVSQVTRDRWHGDQSYRPAALAKVAARLNG